MFSVRRWRGSGAAGCRCEVAARQDRRADARKRFFRRSAHEGGFAERKAMIDRQHDLPITKQAEVLRTQPWQRLLLAAARAGSRPRDHAAARPTAPGVPFRRFANVARLAGRRGVQDRPPSREDANAADGDRSALSLSAHTKPEPSHKIYPYLLRGIEITRPNQVWAMDITYIPMERGFVYLAVVLDWFSRRVLSCECRSRWRRRSASRPSRTRSLATLSRRSSTRTRAASSPARPSPAV